MTTITQLHLNGSDYDIGFNPSNAGTTWQVLTKTAAWYEWDNAPATWITNETTWTTSTASKIWVGTEAEYALITPVATTIYMVY